MKGAGHGEFTVGAKGGASDRYAPLKSVKLQLNGLDRFAERQGSYFNAVQPYEHLKTKPASGVYMYNFGLRPDETQPSGSCNLSRIDNATLVVTTKAGSVAYNDAANVTSDDVTLANVAGNLTNLLVFAESFNVLRVDLSWPKWKHKSSASKLLKNLQRSLLRETLQNNSLTTITHSKDGVRSQVTPDPRSQGEQSIRVIRRVLSTCD